MNAFTSALKDKTTETRTLNGSLTYSTSLSSNVDLFFLGSALRGQSESRITNFLGDMFEAMDIPVEIKVTFDGEDECVNVELLGENMGLLIGKRGQTLDSIQYLTSLVINKGKEKYVRIKVDTENYRQRRKDTLESLAKNIAYKVKRSRRSVALEPMNPYERRIIHSALQNDRFVSTKSEGEEPFRHVVVYLDREKAGNNRYSEHRYSDNNRYSR